MDLETLFKEVEKVFDKILKLKTRNAEEELFAWKVYTTSKFVIKKIEEFLGKEIAPTPKAEINFNVFKINLEGGW
jgi:ferritin-like protein